MRKIILLLMLLPCISIAQIKVSNKVENKGSQFTIVAKSIATSIFYDTTENVLIEHSARFLASDIEKVTGKTPKVLDVNSPLEKSIIIVGTADGNSLIKKLAAANKIDVKPLENQWEKFMIQTVDKPFDGVKEALVIVGSDRRGAVYGVFTLSEEMGVSPLYWWADVPVKKNDEIYLNNVKYVSNSPSVQYRGIFINDEAPALTGWVEEKFGAFDHTFYKHVFELLLRNKANFLWPSMWQPRAFNDDDPLNPKLADEYGIVMSTSHHEPMMRAHDEWTRYGDGPWNYETNKEKLREFWKGGIERMGDYESIVTMGMRGDGDEAMSEETAVDLMKEIITDQRKIIEEVTDKPAEETPQVWAIYKEVQDYYDKGLRVDDDITILFCDDNWGNVRILPKKEDQDYKGGYGMYYHFDFVGGPVSYRWLNVTQIERTWEQMNLTFAWGVDKIWLVNVGDIKPMEFPISFFLDYAFNAESIKASDLPGFYTKWTRQQFGGLFTEEISELVSLYTKYNARRTPEMLKPDTYSLFYYDEANRIVNEYNELKAKSQKIYDELPSEYKDAFYQLVHSPILLCSNLNEMYVSAAKNTIYASQQRASTNKYADKVKEHFDKDAELTREYHEDLSNGKWNHFMAQTHIGYTSWNNPPVNQMPSITYIQNQKEAGLGYVIEHGVEPPSRWFARRTYGLFSRSFSTFDPINDQKYFVEIFNRGLNPLKYTITSSNDWIKISKPEGTVEFEERVYISIDWDKAPKGTTSGEITIVGAGTESKVIVPIRNEMISAAGFIENNDVISIDAANFTNKIDVKNIQWTVVPNLGRTGSSVIIQPANAEVQKPGKSSPSLEYVFTVFDSGALKINTYVSPTQDYKKKDGLKFAIAIDDEAPQIININEGEDVPDWKYPKWFDESVGNHIKLKMSAHKVEKPGVHTLKVWMIDPGIVIQKFVIDAGGEKPSYLGPPQSLYLKP